MNTSRKWEIVHAHVFACICMHKRPYGEKSRSSSASTLECDTFLRIRLPPTPPDTLYKHRGGIGRTVSKADSPACIMIHAALWNGAVHSNARSSLKKFGCTVRKEADFASADEVGNVVQHQNAEDDD
jgi:hypothetical protein